MNRQPTTDQVQGLPHVATHGVVNHSVTFVDPTTGVHTPHVESYWGRIKKKLRGCKDASYPPIWMSLCGRSIMEQQHAHQAFSIIADTTQQYPV